MSKNLDRLGFDGLIAEYRSRGYSIGLTAVESGGDDEAKERCEQRFLLLRIMLVHPEMNFSEFKVCSFLLLFKYNDNTGRCDPSVDTIALATNLQPRTVRKAL